MRSASGHAPESLFHVQTKELIARWARRRYRQSEVQVEQATDNRSRVADVMITTRNPPGCLAVKIQYSKLGSAEWQAKHDSYAEQGITEVWFSATTTRTFTLLATAQVSPSSTGCIGRSWRPVCRCCGPTQSWGQREPQS